MKKAKKKWIHTLLCMLLTFGTVFSLCACPAPGPTPPTPTPPSGDDPPVDNPPGTGEGGSEGNVPEPTPGDTPYSNGATIEGAGADLTADSTAMTPAVFDETGAEEITANGFFRGADKGAGKVFRIADGNALTFNSAINKAYDGEGSILIAPNGVVFAGGHDIVLENLTIVGDVTLQGAANVTMKDVQIISQATALTVDAASSHLLLEDCRITGKTAISNGADGLTVLHSYLSFTEAGIADTAKVGTVVYNCLLEGTGTGISLVATDGYLRNCTLSMQENDTGIVLGENTLNTLVAQNVITGAQSSMVISAVKNTAVVLNSLISITASNTTNLYVCDNAMGGRLTANNNNYLLADGNTYPDDALDHETVQTGNQNHNGDSLMDVDARLEVGADDALLPHVNKELFVGMELKNTVTDLTAERPRALRDYILEQAKKSDVVIIAPGAYTLTSTMSLTAAHSNTTLYAYGVYMEQQTGVSAPIKCDSVTNLSFKGLTVGYKQQSSGQVYVLEKLGQSAGKYTIRVVTGAGMMNEFGNTNPLYYNTTGMGAQRQGTFYAYCDTSFKSITKDNTTSVPTMIMEVTEGIYNMLAKGDILTCRMQPGASSNAIQVQKCCNVSFKDFTLYGTATGMAFYENRNLTGVKYYRVANTTKNGFIIDEALYNKYLALEEKYGVDLEVSIDELGRHRGSLPHIGSIDATHVIACAEGSQATSCLFENMCDDATNQHAHHDRLADVRDQGNGTTMLVFKPALSKRGVVLNNGSLLISNGPRVAFAKGQRVYVYNSQGRLVCDTKALSASVDLKETKPLSTVPGATIPLHGVLVPTEAINLEAIEGFDLSDDSQEDTHKVMIDNMDMCCNYFNFDNCKIQNIRSRGLLIKASNGTITNCTFRNIGMACAAILYELYYGESGVTENLLVDRNLFDHTGYFVNQDLYATISITGLGSSVEEDYLLYKNITISNNVIKNRTTDYAVYVNSARDVKIVNNDFGSFVGNDFTSHPEEPETATNPKPAIHIHGAMNIEISDNKYSQEDWGVDDYIHAEKHKNIFGTDVTIKGIPLIPDDPS